MKSRACVLASIAIWSVSLLLGGCGATPAQLRVRAAFDLGCDPAAISTRELDAGTRVASGCGRQAVYVENFNQSVHPVWMLNSEVRSLPSGKASAPSAP
jgi:hypothetical protein